MDKISEQKYSMQKVGLLWNDAADQLTKEEGKKWKIEENWKGKGGKNEKSEK